MSNIVKETVEFLKKLGYLESDVLWVGSRDGEFAMSWEDFKDKFKDLEYDSGYGAQEIAYDLVVVGDNWWLEREDYDGAENWVYEKYPKITSGKGFDKIIGGWDSLADIMWEAKDDSSDHSRS